MQRCHCPLSALQWISLCLNQDSLPFDKVLQIGSELSSHIKTILDCPRCAPTRRVSHSLSQVTSRLVCFYEAAYHGAATDLANRSTATDLSSRSTPRGPACQSVFCEMKLGKLPIRGPEARMLVEVVLVEACLDLNERIQEWKQKHIVDGAVAQDGQHEEAEGQGESITRCLDRLAKLIGLLHFDGLPLECP